MAAARLLPLSLALASLACAREPEAEPLGPVLPGPRPNVVLLVAEGLDPRALSSEGATAWTTSAIDALASAGTRFTQANAPTDVGAAARWSLLSGEWPREHGVAAAGDEPRAGTTFLPGQLAQAGYECVAFTLGAGASPDAGFERGGWRRAAGSAVPSTPQAETPDAFGRWLATRGAGGRPFFAWVDLGALPAWSAAAARGSGPGPDVRIDEARREVEALDASVGRVLEALAVAGLGDATLVALTATHPRLRQADATAPHLGPGSLGVPLVLRLSGRIPAGEARSQLVTHLDLAATLAELCGAPLPGRPERASFARLLLKQPQPWRDVAFAEAREGGACLARAALQRRWKLLWRAGDPPRLYDREADPGERTDLSGESAGPAARAAADLATRLIAWGEG